MLRLVTGEDEIIATFVGNGIKRSFYQPYRAIGWVTPEWTLVGGAVFNDYNGTNMEVTIYGPRAFNRQTIRDTFKYVFEHCKCARLTARTERRNKKMRRILPRMGFIIEGELKHFFGTVKSSNALIFRLERETAERWMK